MSGFEDSWSSVCCIERSLHFCTLERNDLGFLKGEGLNVGICGSINLAVSFGNLCFAIGLGSGVHIATGEDGHLTPVYCHKG